MKNVLYLNLGFFQYDKYIKKELENHGFCVTDFSLTSKTGIFDRFISMIYKNLASNRNKKLKQALFQVVEEKGSRIDFVFVINGAILTAQDLKRLKKLCFHAEFILYFWDDISRACTDIGKLKYFDRIFTFDKQDAEKYNLIFRPLFYADCFELSNDATSACVDCPNKKKIYDISFIGSIHSDRIAIIKRCMDMLNSGNYSFYLYLLTDKWHFLIKGIKYPAWVQKHIQRRTMDLESIADILKKSRASLDIQQPTQSGLTMRTFECLAANTKLITTNTDIVNYDFYNEKNIMVIQRDKIEINQSFIDSSYEPIVSEIKNKYSLHTWVKDIFNE